MDAILREYGAFTQLLPDELKIYGKDKGYGAGPSVHKVDASLVYANKKAIIEGKAFKKRIDQYVYE